MSFTNRIGIEGTLTTLSSLHIGDGGTVQRPGLQYLEAGGRKPVDINSVAIDVSGKPFIPGTALKGVIRSWLKENPDNNTAIEQVFGSDDTDKKDAVGGKAEFWDARLSSEPVLENPPPYWDPERLTGVTASIAVDRRTRTVVEKKLRYEEFIPSGTVFGVRISGQDLGDEEIDLLLFALEQGFHAENPIIIGASTSNGWGRCSWKLADIKSIDKEGVKQWIEEGVPTVGYGSLRSLPEQERERLRNRARSAPLKAAERLKFGITLRFDSLFLTDDPERRPKQKPDHRPRRNTMGKVFLAAESFRGAFRSQAERIIRTLGGHACDPVDPCREPDTQCLTCEIFGAAGWKAPVVFSDFVCEREPEPLTQEFVAIDRFTGGGADKLKFNAEAVIMPVLSGTMTADLARLGEDRRWALGLIGLALWDLIEGDVTFGFGAAKGYGTCTAEVTGLDKVDWSACVAEFREKVGEKGGVE